MQYVWNQFVSSFFIADVGVKQDSALSQILSALYIMPILHIFEKNLKILFSLFRLQFFHLLIIVSLFPRKKAMKNPTQICFVAIILFSPYLTSLV